VSSRASRVIHLLLFFPFLGDGQINDATVVMTLDLMSTPTIGASTKPRKYSDEQDLSRERVLVSFANASVRNRERRYDVSKAAVKTNRR